MGISKIINAVVLAAGKGTRLGKITKNIPKPMINIYGKPKTQTTNRKSVNAGVYLIEPAVLNGMMKEGMDFGMDVIPHLIEVSANVYGFKINSSIIAIDTPEFYTYYNNQ